MSAPAQPVPIAIAIVQRGDQFLIGQRPPGVALAGLWEFPGGKVQPAESPEDAAVRECLEETGLSVSPTFRYPEHVQSYVHGQVHLHFVHCEVQEDASAPLAPFRWVERRELANYEFPAGNQLLLAQLLSELG
jgi:8-oxo-dGTP diphosphatase